MFDLKPLAAVQPSTYNPRHTDPERLEIVMLSLRKLGFVLPIYADADGEIISGHQRHLAATKLGMDAVPVAFTKPMSLGERKAVNIAFNRGTNDMRASTDGADLQEALSAVDIKAMAESLPDKRGDDRFPCLRARFMPIKPLLEANKGRWIPYAKRISCTLRSKGVLMPVIVGPGLRVVNGIGRLEMLAEAKADKVLVVELNGDEAAFAEAMLNHLSMDFDVHTRYRDLLRYNSFRRARRVRSELGRGFLFAVAGNTPAREWDVQRDPAKAEAWRRFYGSSVVDFGAGHLHETDMLRDAGVHVTPFEPFRLGAGNTIDRDASVALSRAFLQEVASGRVWSSVFISSVLNSVPFKEDREHIACICAALCGARTRLFAVASSVKQSGWQSVNGKEFVNESDGNVIAFKLDYEPGIRLGDISEVPKVQKYHTSQEFYALFKQFFAVVNVSEAMNNVQAVAAKPLPVDPARLRAALAFEFDLPYPDGSRMGLVPEAIAAFSTRLGVQL